VVERTLVQNDREMILVLAKALGFDWETAMALVFLGARNHRIPSGELDGLKDEFSRLDADASRGVLKVYQSRKNAAAVEADQRRLPQLHA
jgi:hypothetical protein